MEYLELKSAVRRVGRSISQHFAKEITQIAVASNVDDYRVLSGMDHSDVLRRKCSGQIWQSDQRNVLRGDSETAN